MNNWSRIFISFVATVFLLSYASSGFAYERNEHDSQIESVLFNPKPSSNKSRKNINLMEDAVALTIDQFGNKMKAQFKGLKKDGIKGLPPSFSLIKYDKNFSTGESINPNNHRQITHEGWNHKPDGIKAQIFWKSRKKVLLATTNTVFELKANSLIPGNNDTCDSLSGLVYCIHLLGDIIEKTEKGQEPEYIQTLGHEASPNDENDLITDLTHFSEVLFNDQKHLYSYKHLIKEMEDIRKRAIKITSSSGRINTTQEIIKYHQCAVDLLVLLQDTIPDLLHEEEYFCRAFY